MASKYLASIVNPVLNGSIGNVQVSSGVDVTGSIIRGLINVAFIVGAITFVAMLLWGGVEYISSGGDKEGIQKSTKRLTTALIGLIILLSFYAILGIISALTGLNLVNLVIPSFNNT